MNGALFDPSEQTLIICARRDDLSLCEDDGLVVIRVENLDEGIEIPHAGDRLWHPV